MSFDTHSSKKIPTYIAEALNYTIITWVYATALIPVSKSDIVHATFKLAYKLIIIHMLYLVQHKISTLKIRSHYFSVPTLWHITVDHSISKTLLDQPIYHNSSSIFNHYFSKCRSPCPLLFLPFLFVAPAYVQSWSTFVTFF